MKWTAKEKFEVITALRECVAEMKNIDEDWAINVAQKLTYAITGDREMKVQSSCALPNGPRCWRQLDRQVIEGGDDDYEVSDHIHEALKACDVASPSQPSRSPPSSIARRSLTKSPSWERARRRVLRSQSCIEYR